MLKRSRKPKSINKSIDAVKNRAGSRRPKHDENQAAFAALQRVIEQTEGTGKNPLAVALGRLGGLKGGKARAKKLSAEERSASAAKAAQARWKGKS